MKDDLKRKKDEVKERVKEHMKEHGEKVREQFAQTGEAVREKMKHPLINKVIVIFIILFALWEGLLYLHGQSYITIPDVLFNSSRIILVCLVTIIVTSLVVRFTSNKIFKMFEGEVDIEYRIFLTKLYAFSVYVFGILIILYFLGISLTQLTLGLTFLATGIAFAIREILLSYFVWAILLTKKPFRIGDIITMEGEDGRVKRIGTFYVTVQKTDGSVSKLPNKLFLEKVFKVHGPMCKELIDIRLSSPPADAASGFESTKKLLKEVVGSEVKVNLRTKDDALQLVIEYDVNIENKTSTRTKVLSKLHGVHKEVVYRTV